MLNRLIPNHFFATVVTLIIALVAVHECDAGIVIGTNGILESAELDYNGATYNITFQLGSYNDIETSGTNLSDQPWHNVSGDAANIIADNLAASLRDEMNIVGSAFPFSAYSYVYVFAYADKVGSPASYHAYYVSNPTASFIHGWESDVRSSEENLWFNKADADGDFLSYQLVFATSSGVNSAVPEPSTAIAMGLLGIVGFAGNRRRRRQESVA